MEILAGHTLWTDELSFSNWLHKNIFVLGDVLGLDLVSRQREAPVGRLSADILADIRGAGHAVIIENQIYNANHGHFGQVLTYSAYYNAHVIVWIATAFRDEYRHAIAWLNGLSDKQFYAVELKGVEGNVARFEVVAGPMNAISRKTQSPDKPVIVAKQGDDATDDGAYVPAPFRARTPGTVSPGQLALNSTFELIAQNLTGSTTFRQPRPVLGDRNYYVVATGPVPRSEWSVVFTNSEIRLELVFNDPSTALENVRRASDAKDLLEEYTECTILLDAQEGRQKQKIIISRAITIVDRSERSDELANWCAQGITSLAEAVQQSKIYD